MELSSPAIVIGKRDIGETDRMYSFLTRERGKVVAVARGVRKPMSKLAGQIETLNFVDLSVMRNRGRGNVAGAIAEQSFPRIRSDFLAFRSALRAAAVVNALVDEDEADRKFFRLFLEYLRALDMVSALPVESEADFARREEKCFLLTNGFLWKALDRLGYRVESHCCAAKGEPLIGGDRYAFSPDAGGIVCSAHRAFARTLLSFPENAVKALRIFLAEPLPLLPKLSLPMDARRALRNALEQFLKWNV